MAQSNTAKNDYLAVVSEWSSQTRSGGVVGNAYPIMNLTEEKAVEEPETEFANSGAIFLMTRGSLNTWDFVRIRPRENSTYKNKDDRDCFFIPQSYPTVLQSVDDLGSVAVVLHHPTFDPASNHRQLLNPSHNVTPLFFIRKQDAFFGPLIRETFQLSAADDTQRIDWRPAEDDGIVYEFTQTQLLGQGLKLLQYDHPAKERNRVLKSPIQLAVGKIRTARSPKAHDTLPMSAVIDWYIRRCPSDLMQAEVVASLRNSFKLQPTDSSAIVAARLKKIETVMATHAMFAEQRERFARDFLKSPAGQQRVDDVIEQTVKRMASEIQLEVDRQEAQLAAQRDDLAAQLQAADAKHRQQLQAFQSELDAAMSAHEELNAASRQLKATLTEDACELAIKMREQIPLIAALTGARNQSTVDPVTSVPRTAFRTVVPSKPLQAVTAEKRLVEDLQVDLARQGLNYSRDFVANIYTCLKSEALNLIIGPPGYGKSMLVTAMARSLGHADAFLPITVRRSWAEDRHLLGYFDTFNKRYDPGSTRLVPRMLQAERDWRSMQESVYLVLLDEFNLSAPEYYCSQLLQALPSDDAATREVTLYDPENQLDNAFPYRIELTPNLRFWGTINYDETTERLSPRTLDRTGMIFLGDADVRLVSEDDQAPMPGVTAKDLFEKFCRGSSDCPADRWGFVSEVLQELRNPDAGLGPRIELSPRVQKGIRRYLANSEGVLDAKRAVDFVVQQRILPVIRGRGDEYLARIRRLHDTLGKLSLDRTARHVEETLRQSENQFGEVDFLSY